MKIEQRMWTEAKGWQPNNPALESAQLVLAFGATPILRSQEQIQQIREAYPAAHVIGCSTAGEIQGIRVRDNSLAITSIQFEHTQIRGAQTQLGPTVDSFQAGKQLAQSFRPDGLVHVFVLSDGNLVNGSELVQGLVKHLPPNVALTGGLAGDGSRFEQTLVFLDTMPAEGRIAALGFYGNRLRVGYGSMGGWDPFGPDRLITRAEGNVLYELDGQSALGLYKKYLGEYAADLPASALLFPLQLRTPAGETGVVRTILSIDEQEGSMFFAGNVPEGTYARLMKANFERLVDGAMEAAQTNYRALNSSAPDLAILISCVGRKLVLGQMVEEEVEAVQEVLGKKTALTGFYSYGEIAPFTPSAACKLHNQTMTITTFSEV